MQKNILILNNELIAKAKGLDIAYAVMSNESFSSFVKDISNLFIAKLKTISGIFGTNKSRAEFHRSGEISLAVKHLRDKKSQMERAIRSTSYTIIKDQIVPTLVGLNVDMLTAAKSIQNVFDTVHSVCIPGLEELDLYISKVITDRDTRMATKPVGPNEELVKATNELQAILETNLSSSKVADTAIFKDLFPNIQDIEQTFNILVNMSMSPTIKDMQYIDNTINGIVSRINTIVNEMKDRDYEISKAVLGKLAKDVEIAANNVTVVTSHILFYNQLVSLLTLIITRLAGK